MLVLSSHTTMSFLPAFYLGNQFNAELTIGSADLWPAEVTVSAVPH